MKIDLSNLQYKQFVSFANRAKDSDFAQMGREDLFQKARKALGPGFLSMCVTPKDIDAMVKDGASILSYGLNLALFGENYEALEGLMR